MADRMVRLFFTGAQLLLLVALCSSCSCGSLFARRPPIIATDYPEVLEFVPPPEEFESEVEDRVGYAPLEPQFFDPYQPMVEECTLRYGDVVEISVFGHNDTAISEAVVAPDGKLYYLFLDGVDAEGKSVSEVEATLENALCDYFVDPKVTLIPKRLSSSNYCILGKVRYPGTYPITSSVTLRQAVGEAGGLSTGGVRGTTTISASLADSFIVRDGCKLDVDFACLLQTEGGGENIYVRPGDYIYIASGLVQQVFLLGEVAEPRAITYKDNLTLTGVLAGVGGVSEGWSRQAYITEVLVVRGSFDCPNAYQVNVLDILAGKARDVCLMPGDLIYVQPKPFKFGRELVRLAIQAFVSSFAGNIGYGIAGSHWFRAPDDS